MSAKIDFKFWILTLIFEFCLLNFSYAAPCYGTKMPERKELVAGLQSYAIFDRDLEEDFGSLRSMQDFFMLSYGIFDWLSLDLKAGSGNIKQRSPSAEKLDYTYNFAGGYGFRLRLYDAHKIKAVFGFQHISVHPKRTYVAGVKQKAVLDDWQVSALASYDLGMVIPYIGARWSRVDYIHWNGQQRKRRMSDPNKSWGLIAGLDIPIYEKIWINLEGSFLDSQAFATSINFKF